ncbi:MAG: FAD-binding oxidoreductase [Pseudomonadota bacterium]
MLPDSAQSCLWQHTCKNRIAGEELQEDLKADVTIVGGGFTGLRAAIELASNGCSVNVMEAADIGAGASGLNGGQVNPMLPVAVPEDLRRNVGDFWFERMTQASLASADDLFHFIQKHNIDCDARQNGWLRAQHNQKSRRQAISAAEKWNKFGAGFEFLDAEETATLSGSSAYVGGIVSPRGGAVQPLSLLYGMAKKAISLGVRVFRNARVDGMKRINNQWHLSAGPRTVISENVILATNGYTDNLVKPLAQSILPLSPIQIATEPLANSVADTLLPEGHTISDTQRLIMYCRKEPDNRFVYGGIGFRGVTGAIKGFGWLLKDAGRIFPQLKNVKFTFRWGGQIALTEDRVPHMHEIKPGVFAGLGYNGRGVAISSVMGINLAKRILGTAANGLDFPISPVKPYRFGAIQSLGSGLAMRFMRFQDRMEFQS